jgi:acid phosphatase
VTAGARYGGSVDHYRMLCTIEAAYGLPALGTAASRQPVTGIWR